MRKIVCVSVPFILSDYHVMTAKDTVNSLRCSTLGDSLVLIAVANRLRDNDYEALKGLYDEIYVNDQNILARAWNRGIARARELGASHILVHNLDIMIHSQGIERLVAAVDAHPEIHIFSPQLWHTKETLEQAKLEPGLAPKPLFSCFMIRPNFTELAGDFDELFAPAYQEDHDILYRMKLLGLNGVVVNDALIFHTEGGTIRGCLSIRGMTGPDKIALFKSFLGAIKTNDGRYAEKWGGLPSQERFKTPFDKPINLRATKQGDYR